MATDSDDDDPPPYPLVIIINLNAAINLPPQPIQYLFDPVNDTPNPDSVYAGKVDDLPNVTRSHTLNIEDGYLYVASRNQFMPIYDLDNYITGPTNPVLVTNFYINSSPLTELHEIYAISHAPNTATMYLSCLKGGLNVFDFNYTQEGERVSLNVSSSITHIYDSDRAYPDLFDSGDALFDYRLTHSAWPTDDEEYVFTTDELNA